jgi:hypothetical protein
VLVVAKNFEAQRLAGILRDDPLHFVEGADVLSVDRHDPIAWLELARGRMSRQNDPDRRRQERPVGHEHRKVEKQREHQVHRGPRENDRDAFVDRQRFERALSILGQHEIALRLLEHLHVAAERNQTDAVLGLTPSELQDLRTEAEAESDDLDPEGLGHRKVAELVHEDERADQNDEVEEVHAREAASRPAAPALGARERSMARKTRVACAR